MRLFYLGVVFLRNVCHRIIHKCKIYGMIKTYNKLFLVRTCSMSSFKFTCKIVTHSILIFPFISLLISIAYRNSRPGVFCKTGALKIFAKFTGKHLCQSLIFNKVAGLNLQFNKKESLAQVFSC